MDSLKIIPYCIPDEDIEYNFFKNYPSFNLTEQEEEFDFFNRIDAAVELFFQKAFTEIEPLLDEIALREIHLVSDYTGMIIKNQSIASWLFGRSKTENGHYILIASPTLISASLHLVNNPDVNVGNNICSTWQHELIHLADQKAILRSGKWCEYNSDCMIRRKYLSSFREEGIADLWYLGKGHAVAITLDAGRIRFQQDLERIAAIDLTTLKNRKAYGRLVNDTEKTYSAGPVMVLHALSVSSDEEIAKQAKLALEKIADRTLLSNEEIFSLIRAAIKMDIETFMTALENPADDGKPFTNLKCIKETILYKKIQLHEDTCCAS